MKKNITILLVMFLVPLFCGAQDVSEVDDIDVVPQILYPEDTVAGYRPKVGLVLGGGGAKGAAHAGALKAIEESGIRIDCIAGTSIGAIVGGMYAVGYTADDIQALFRSQEWLSLLSDRVDSLKYDIFTKDKDGVTYVFGIPISRKGTKKENSSFGAIPGDKIQALFNRLIDAKIDVPRDKKGVRVMDMAFDSLPIPFRCVAADVRSMEEIDFEEGDLGKAMRASMAIPGLFKTVPYDGRSLIDGGVVNNLPADLVKAMGADIIIAVDLSQNKPDDDGTDYNILNLGGIIGWALSRPDMRKYRENREVCDVYINPNLGGYGTMSFSEKAVNEMISMGYKEAKKILGKVNLDKIKK